MSKTFLFQVIQFSQTVLIQTIQFSISMQLVLFNPFNLSGATIPGQSGPGSNGNEGVLHIPQSSSITWNLTIRLFSVIPRTLVGEGGFLPLCRGAIGVFYSPSRLGNIRLLDFFSSVKDLVCTFVN